MIAGVSGSEGFSLTKTREKLPFPHRRQLFGHDHIPLHNIAWYPHTIEK